MKKADAGKILWRKAAVLGSLWAASEIVPGSFLHNAHIPFSGEFLTAVGIIILVAGHRLWPERGLLWRTGLVCAAMKSVSPSAVILGPMVAIAAEGLLAETGIIFLGTNSAGYLLAGGLAMLGTLVYKLLRLFMLYGPDTIRVYLRSVEWLRGVGIAVGDVWLPLLAVCAVYLLGGAAAALAGISGGKEHLAAGRRTKKGPNAVAGDGRRQRPHSVSALAGHLIFIAAVLAAGRAVPVAALAAGAGLYGSLCAIVYPRARGLLRRVGLWAGVLGASVFAGLVLGSIPAGLYMALRAFLVTLGFSAIGEELLNPAIRRGLERIFGGVFFETLESAFSSLPGIIAGLPAGRDFIRRPLASLRGTVARAPFLLEGVPGRKVFIITGPHGSGKSELVAKLAGRLSASGKKPAGILAAGLWEGGKRSGFDLVDLSDGSRTPLCRRADGGGVRAGEFRFFEKGLAAGAAALSPGVLSAAGAIFIDEVGFLELEGKGWAVQLGRVLAGGGAPLIISVRDYLGQKVSARWGLSPEAVWKAGETDAEAAYQYLAGFIECRGQADT